MYQRLAKVVKTDKEREAFLQPLIMPVLYYLLGKKRLYKMIAKGEYDAAVGYEHLIADFPEVESVKNDEKHHGDIVSGLLDT